MASESKWKREKLGQRYTDRVRHYNDNYDKDDTVNMNYEESPLTKVLIGSLAIAGGVAAYKSGLLKNAMGTILEHMDARDFTGTEAVKTFRDWLIKNEDIPERSIVRSRVRLMEFFKNKGYRDLVVEDSKEDFNYFLKKVKTNIDNVKNLRKNNIPYDHLGTDLLMSIGGANKLRDSIIRNRRLGIHDLNEKLALGIFNASTIDENIRKTQFNRRGYASLTLGDILKINNRGELEYKATSFKFSDESILKNINEALKQTVTIDGKKTNLIKSNAYKSMVLDKNIMISEAGKIIDLRQSNKSFKFFLNSLSNDFQIPIIGFNPLRLVDINRFYETKYNFGILWEETVQGAVTNKAGRVTVKEAVSKSPLVVINGDIFKFNQDSRLIKIAENKRLINVTENVKNRFGLSRELNSYRKIWNLGFTEVKDEYQKVEGFKYWYSKVMKKMNIGFQDADPSFPFSAFDPSTYMNIFYKKADENNLFAKTVNKMKPYRNADKHDWIDVFGKTPADEDLFVAVNVSKKMNFKGKTFKEAANEVKNGMKNIGKSLIAGRNNLGDVNPITTIPYFLFERLNATLGSVGLALGNDDLGSTASVFKNLMLKRFLPILVGYNAAVEIGRIGQHKDEEGKNHNIYSGISNFSEFMSIGFNKIRDIFHITPAAKKLRELMPGFEQITEIPGFGWLDMTKTTEEKKEFYDKGMVPVRKGRYWSTGNTPFTGGKTEYFIPNVHRRVESDYKFTDTLYGSRDEYLANSAIPSLSHPLSPLRHFIFDRYHYEKKHYEDRPYLQTSPAFSDAPIVGPILSNTIGRILKPSVKMHKEYWKDSENVGTVASDKRVSASMYPYGFNSSFSKGNKVRGKIGALKEEDLSDFDVSYDEAEDSDVYITSSGRTKLVNLNDESIKKVRRQIKKDSINKVVGVTTTMHTKKSKVEQEIESPTSLKNMFLDEYKTLSDVAGIYGFATTAFITGDGNVNSKRIETSGYAYSLNRSFWDMNLGGYGGDLSEIFRRFVPKRRKDIEWYNPVKNTMPSWIPGEEYFTDYQHGDPYSKIPRGEIRLPGVAYEKIWGINDPTELKIGSSFIGKGPADIVKHFLKQDAITDPGQIEAIDEGNRVHKKLENKWLREGIALDIEGQINDPVNKIIGFYDARIVDETSPTHEAIVDFKVVNPKKFKGLKEAVEANKRQVNYYLWATGNPKGYLYYINKDNEEEMKVFEVKYSKRLLKQTLKDLKIAREYVTEGLRNNTIARGDLYDQIDRLRILADVAPYSDQYKEVNAIISKMKLNKEEEAQVKMIKSNLKEQKQSLRIYPYKFKNAELDYETVHVTKVLDANTFYTEEFPDNPIRLAGVRISNDKNDKTAAINRKEAEKYIHKGARLKIGVDADPLARVSKDKYSTMHAVVYKNGRNLNRYFIKKGIGKENEKDNTATGVKARYTEGAIKFGSVWETIAHSNTMINNKILQVRSAYEDYHRRNVYGKDFKQWDSPYSDFIKPAFNQMVAGQYGLLSGALIGFLFGAGGSFYKNRYSRFGKIVGPAIGVSVAAAGKLYKKFYEAKNDTTWIPKERRDERELNEYMDIIKYLKYKRLYEEYANKSLKKEHFDIKEFLKKEKESGDIRKARAEKLKEIKLKIEEEGLNRETRKLLKEADLKFKPEEKTDKEYIHSINKEINEIKNHREIKNIPPLAMMALEYNNLSEKTMYAYDKGEPIENVLAGIPKKERQYMKYFLKAKGEERMKILEIAPRYIRRPLESAWGMPVEDKPDLVNYFKSHQLPGADWEGWQENVDIDAVKVKLIRHEGLEFSEFNVWNNDVLLANEAGNIPLPKINHRESEYKVRNKLYDILHGIGMRDVKIETFGKSKDLTFELDLKEDKREEIEKYIKNYEL